MFPIENMMVNEETVALVFARANKPKDKMMFQARLKSEAWKDHWLNIGCTNILTDCFENAADRFNKRAINSGLDKFKGPNAEKKLFLLIKKTSTKEQFEEMMELGYKIKKYQI